MGARMGCAEGTAREPSCVESHHFTGEIGETGLTGGQKSPCRSIISSAARKFAGRSRGMLGVLLEDGHFIAVLHDRGHRTALTLVLVSRQVQKWCVGLGNDSRGDADFQSAGLTSFSTNL
jgi:hypothetical protein